LSFLLLLAIPTLIEAEVNIQGLVGPKNLKNSTVRVDEPGLDLGVAMDVGGKDWPVRIEGTAQHLGVGFISRIIFGTDSEDQTTLNEFSIGVLFPVWKHDQDTAYAGGGPVGIYVKERGRFGGPTATDHSSGYYLHAGISHGLPGGWRFGVDLRGVFATDIQFRQGRNRSPAEDADSMQVAFTFGGRVR